jgi:hypothetical protein
LAVEIVLGADLIRLLHLHIGSAATRPHDDRMHLDLAGRVTGMGLRRRKQAGRPAGPGPAGWVDPSAILFSLPTICDELPPTSSEVADAADAIFHEDDWRQLELVASVHVPMIAGNLAAIQAIRSERSGIGFDRIHVRREPRLPLDGLRLLRTDLAAVLDPAWHGPVGIAFRSELRRVAGGFAYAGPTSTVYGLELDDVVTTLGVQLTSSSGTQDAGVVALMRLAERFGAFVVDWPGAQSYPAVAGR